MWCWLTALSIRSTLASDTAYHSFAGEVEARTPPRYAAFIPSARHQLSPIAPIDLVGKAADGFSFSNHHLIVTEQGTTVADLMFIGLPINPPKFALSLDGNGGTDITFVAPAAEFWTIKG